MTDQTKLHGSSATWIGFVLAIALAIGWYIDRSKLDKELGRAHNERAAAVEKLTEASAATITAPAEPPAVHVDRAAALPAPEAEPSELASVRAELTSTRSELNATKQALSDSDDTRIEVGKKLQACEVSLIQLRAGAK